MEVISKASRDFSPGLTPERSFFPSEEKLRSALVLALPRLWRGNRARSSSRRPALRPGLKSLKESSGGPKAGPPSARSGRAPLGDGWSEDGWGAVGTGPELYR